MGLSPLRRRLGAISSPRFASNLTWVLMFSQLDVFREADEDNDERKRGRQDGCASMRFEV